MQEDSEDLDGNNLDVAEGELTAVEDELEALVC